MHYARMHELKVLVAPAIAPNGMFKTYSGCNFTAMAKAVTVIVVLKLIFWTVIQNFELCSILVIAAVTVV